MLSQSQLSGDRLATGDRLAAVGVVAAGLAHELNNPIGSILLAARNAKSNPALADECIETILRNARRCAEVVRGVLRVSQGSPSRPEPVAVNLVVESAVRAVADEAKSRRATIGVQLDGSLPPVLAHSLELERVVENLLRNAIQSAESGVRVDVSTACENGSVAIHVSDDGRGVPVPMRDQIFEPFFTTRQEEGGTGLGLSLVRAVVYSYGGTVDVATTDGDGTRFVIALPVAPADKGGA